MPMQPRSRFLLEAMLFTALLVGGATARADIFVVLLANDSGPGTLRDAIDQANATAGADVIRFAAGLANQTILLDAALPNITDELLIDGEDRNVTVMASAGDALVTLGIAANVVEIRDVNLTNGEIVVREGVGLALAQDLIAMGSFDDRISGGGSLEKLGFQAFTLSGTNTYSGGTTISEGTLIGNSVSLQGDIEIGAGAALVFDQPIEGTYSGNLSGEGELEKIGAGRLILTGTNSHTSTTVSEGVLQGDVTSVVGDTTIADGAELEFAQLNAGTYAGALSGGAGATVRKTDPGQLTLSGDNSGLDGVLVFEEGTLFGTTNSLPLQIENAGIDLQSDAVVIDQDFDGTYSGAIEGSGGATSGAVAKAGKGNVTLEGSILAEVFVVAQGAFTLTDLASFDGEFRVTSGTTLQGQSLPGNVTGFAQIDGTVGPGGAGAVGELRTSFDEAIFRPPSTLQIDLIGDGGATSVDLMEATSVTVDPGAHLRVAIRGAPDTMGAFLPILTTANGISGSFAFDQSFPCFDVILDHQANAILVSVAPTGCEVIDIDVRPGSKRNLIDPVGRGLIPVAILGEENFGVRDVDASRLVFGPAGAVPVFDLSNPLVRFLSTLDVNHDGHKDLLSFYRSEETGIILGEEVACLQGETRDGSPFEGCDSIQTVACGLGFELALLLPGLMWLRRRRQLTARG